MAQTRHKTAFALAARPGEIEMTMSGTLALLREAGYHLHMMVLANGSSSNTRHPAAKTIRIRRDESLAACDAIAAAYHESLVDDFEITYCRDLMPRMCAVMREVNPEILLVPSPEDVTEDAVAALRMALTSSFVTGSGNVVTSPKTNMVRGDITLYHAPPRDLSDRLRKSIPADLYVDVSSVMNAKRRMLACHKSQDVPALIREMQRLCRRLGRRSKRFRFAEAWRRHLHFGYSAAEIDPLSDALAGKVVVDRAYLRRLETKT